MIRDLENVRLLPAEGAEGAEGREGTEAAESVLTPLTDEEERRFRTVLFDELGNTISEQGWARFPAYTPEERRRLVEVAHRLSAYWGRQVFVEAEDLCRLRLHLAGYEAVPGRS